jgi:hypothetical protein
MSVFFGSHQGFGWIFMWLTAAFKRSAAWNLPISSHDARAMIRTSTLSLEAWSGDSNFDYSSTAGWESYYTKDQIKIPLTEWHSSVTLESLANHVPAWASSCLMIGCGTSHFPEVVRAGHTAKIVLLDSSPTCIRELKSRYGCSMCCICGDATRLSELVEPDSMDCIFDKGLMDAFFCGDGWTTPTEALLKGASSVLREGGIYLLVSYRLSASSKEFLESVGNQVGLDWKFDCTGSNERVGISIATKLNRL